VLLPSKTEICYDQMWDMLHYMCRERGLVFSPETVHIDFEMAMHNSVRRNSDKRISHAAVFTSAKVCGVRYRAPPRGKQGATGNLPGQRKRYY
jgi:hypothetical protein